MDRAKTVKHEYGETKVSLIGFPHDEDWMEVKRRALVTIHRQPKGAPTKEWKSDILRARHSPIRYARYSFLMEAIPSNTATHFVRHVHAQPYVSTLRNDLQEIMDGDHAPRCTPVDMILDVNAEELMVIANKRLCAKAARLTREITKAMCALAAEATPEIGRCLVPMCEYHGGVCHEMHGCGKCMEG